MAPACRNLDTLEPGRQNGPRCYIDRCGSDRHSEVSRYTPYSLILSTSFLREPLLGTIVELGRARALASFHRDYRLSRERRRARARAGDGCARGQPVGQPSRFLPVISTGEIAPDFGGKPALLAYRRNDEAPAERGFRLVMPGDKHGGRYVRDVVSIEVE